MKTVISVSGNADDLLHVSDDGTCRMTRLFLDGDGDEVVDVSVTSTNFSGGGHPVFGLLEGRDIKITVDVLETDD